MVRSFQHQLQQVGCEHRLQHQFFSTSTRCGVSTGAQTFYLHFKLHFNFKPPMWRVLAQIFYIPDANFYANCLKPCALHSCFGSVPCTQDMHAIGVQTIQLTSSCSKIIQKLKEPIDSIQNLQNKITLNYIRMKFFSNYIRFCFMTCISPT